MVFYYDYYVLFSFLLTFFECRLDSKLYISMFLNIYWIYSLQKT